MSETVTVTIDQLEEIVSRAVKSALADQGRPGLTELPELLKFPEDVLLALRADQHGHISPATVRWWKSQGWLKTVKVGRSSYVKRDEWRRFIEENKIKMAADTRNRGKRFSNKGDVK